MDITTNNKHKHKHNPSSSSTSTCTCSSCELDVSMGNHHQPQLLDQTPFELLLRPSLDPLLHALDLPSSSSLLPTGAQEAVEEEEEEGGQLGAMKEMMYKIAAMQPVDIDPSTIKKPRRRNVRISDDPQSIAARHRRERISERIRILQRLVPGGTKMDTASMLDEAIRYVKFLKRQVHELQTNPPPPPPHVVAEAAEWAAVAAMGAHSGLGFGFRGEGPSERLG